MGKPSPIRLLLVNTNPAISSVVRKHLDGMGIEFRMLDTASREGFLDDMRSHRPHLLLADEGGIPGFPITDVLDAALKHGPEIPLVVLGERQRDHSALRVLSRGALEYVNLAQVECLPSVIGRLLRGQGSPARPENEIQAKEIQAKEIQAKEIRDVAGLMRENQRLVTIGRLTGSIAHEINNPLESITNLLFLMEHEEGLPARVRDYLTMAQKELERVVQISKQTLNFYRDPTSPVPIRLSALLDEVLVLYARKISDKQLQVIRRFGSEEPLVVFPGELRQVFSNLVANAIEASAVRGKLFLRIHKSRFWGDSGIVGMRVTIADNGTGMTAEVSRRIGEAFFTTKGQGGTGLGLWVSRSIIERYGGNLFVRSRTGKRHGTVFSILLPTNLRPQVVGDVPNPKPEGMEEEPENRPPNWLANGA